MGQTVARPADFRSKIEVFFKILKSGCKIEDSKLCTADSLCKLIAVHSILGWRVFWLTMANRMSDNLPPQTALSQQEIAIIDHLRKDSTQDIKKNLSAYTLKIAKLGGYLGRTRDPPPGNTVMWRGLARFSDIQLVAEIGMRLVGN